MRCYHQRRELLVAKPALWELGAEILVRIEENDELVIHNGIDVLWHGILEDGE